MSPLLCSNCCTPHKKDCVPCFTKHSSTWLFKGTSTACSSINILNTLTTPTSLQSAHISLQKYGEAGAQASLVLNVCRAIDVHKIYIKQKCNYSMFWEIKIYLIVLDLSTKYFFQVTKSIHTYCCPHFFFYYLASPLDNHPLRY